MPGICRTSLKAHIQIHALCLKRGTQLVEEVRPERPGSRVGGLLSGAPRGRAKERLQQVIIG